MAAENLESLVKEMRAELGLDEPYEDPGVGAFGLRNAVFAIGACFIDVVSPVRPDTAAGRYMERRSGDCGYMVMFDVDDLEGVRARANGLGVRSVWHTDLPDIAASHLHPADMRGAIVSVDHPVVAGSWRWGGPEWTEKAGAGAPGRLVSVTIAVTDPDSVASRWAQVLGVDKTGDRLELRDSSVVFERCADETGEGLTDIALELPPDIRGGRDELTLGGVRFTLSDLRQAGR